MNEALIDLKNLSCQAGYQYLLRDINWQVRPGEQWVVFGQNGCGKTTLLSIVAGYKGYSSGELRIRPALHPGEYFKAAQKNRLDF